jgi:RNA polymerase sigma-70 factor, ECF subfamily
MASTAQKIEAGQTSEFVQLLTGSQSRLYAYICSLTGRAASARDILQDTNVVLRRALLDCIEASLASGSAG